MGPLLLTNLGNIVTAISGIVALLATINTIAKNRAPRPTILLDPSLKVLTIKRFPVDKALLSNCMIAWGDLKKIQWTNQIVLSAGILIIYTIIYFSIDLFIFDTQIIFYFFGLISGLVFFCTLLYFQHKKYSLFGNTPEEGNFIVFQRAEIVVQSNHHHLIFQCHQSFKKLGAQSVEIESSPDASRCCVASPATTIHISASEGVPGAYSVVIETLGRISKEEIAKPVENAKVPTSHLNPIQLRIAQTKFIISLVDQSKYTNLLINQIVSKQDFDKGRPEGKLGTLQYD